MSEPYIDGLGNVIPDDYFENEPSYEAYKKAKISPEMEAWLDALPERLSKPELPVDPV